MRLPKGRARTGEVLTAGSGVKALETIRDAEIDLVITDLKMPAMNGMELLKETKRLKPDVPVIVMTAFATIETAVEAMKRNAYDYITKPFQNEQLKLMIRKALENLRLVKQNRLLSAALSERFKFGSIIGKSEPMRKIYDIID